MSKRFVIFPLVFLMCLTFGCQEGEEAAEAVSDVMADVATVKGLTDSYDEAHDAGDAEKLVSIVYADFGDGP